MNSLTIQNGSALLPDGSFTKAEIGIEGHTITSVGGSNTGGEAIDAAGLTVLPGLIDIHCHGIRDVSVLSEGGSLFDFARYEAACGTTRFYPTLFSPPDMLSKILAACLDETNGLADTPQIGGFRLESPYLAKTGAGLGKDLMTISDELTGHLLDAGRGHIAVWDISPELDGAPDTIARLADDGVVTSMAHTSATIEQARAAVNAGLTLVTHLFDTFDLPEAGDPGVYPATLVDYLLVEDRVWCEIIGDGTHVDPLLVEKAMRCKSPEKLVFVTDSNYGAGLPSGDYTLPGDWGRVRIDGSNNGVRLIDRGLALAGSALTPIDGFRNAVKLFGWDMPTASRICSKTQAELLGLNTGELRVGLDADLMIIDDEFTVRYTIARGEVVYRG